MDSDGEDDTPPLLRAAYEGDLPALRRAIADGADVNVEGEIDEDGDGPYTALHWLVNNTPQADNDIRIACIDALLDAGADDPPGFWNHPDRGDCRYLQRVADAGGWEAYRRAHVDKLALLFTPKPETGSKRRRSKRRRSPLHGLPPELVRRVVEYWAHAGYY